MKILVLNFYLTKTEEEKQYFDRESRAKRFSFLYVIIQKEILYPLELKF